MNPVPAPCAACSSGADPGRTIEKRTLLVALITLTTMAAEIVFGLLTGSMALLADGIHMGTHALALGITVGAYALARRWHRHPGFSFGTGKVGVLGGYTNALLLAATAVFMAVEAVERLIDPQALAIDLALSVATLGLAVNLISAWLLGHDHDHEDHEHHRDANHQAALAHVVADALTSVLAIAALVVAKLVGWVWLDPVVALLGAGLILSWSWGLIKTSGSLLLDFGDYGAEAEAIRRQVELSGGQVRDLHIWRYGEQSRSLLLAVTPAPGCETADQVRASLRKLTAGFRHVTIEVGHAT